MAISTPIIDQAKMQQATATNTTSLRHLAEYSALIKPRITIMALLTCAAGASVAPPLLSLMTWFWLLLGTALIVGAANTLNMYLERDVDRYMSRTKNRPLPAGRLSPTHAVWFGAAQAISATITLTFGVNPLTALLGVFAFVVYVHIYTPMKRKSHLATWVGAVPGAMPALMGWTATTNTIALPGLLVFGLLLIWQLPHFYAISLFREKEYTMAGLVTLPRSQGVRPTAIMIAVYAVLQFGISLTIYMENVAGLVYLAIACGLGIPFTVYCWRGFTASNNNAWARKVFLFSILYLPAVFVALVINSNH